MRGPVILFFACMALAAQPQQNFYSLGKEAALGRQMALEFRRNTVSFDDLIVQQYVDRLGQKLAAQIPNANFPFSFSLTANDPCHTTHEPQALPGGYVFVPVTLLIQARSEAEFAGMLAHSMEHIAERHAARITTRLTNVGNLPLIFMGGCPESHAVPLGLLPTLREQELEADALAAAAIARAGFDPAAFVSYLEREHVPERAQALNPIVERFPASDYIETTSQFIAVQERIAPVAAPGSLSKP
jgi:beta-barrel assembly-enhancing protease